MTTPPDGRQPARSTGRPGDARPPDAVGPGAALAPREQQRLDEAVVTVARRGRSPAVVTALVAGAFLLGLVRPWDWLAGVSGGAMPEARPGGALDGPVSGDDPAAGASGPPGGSTGVGAAGAGAGYQAPTCAYPSSWRTASIQLWAGREARVWTAAEAVVAAGPADPSIPFHAVASDTVEAIGWCAPVTGPDRPPATAVGTLYRILDGSAAAVPVQRLEPAAASALGELWVPVSGAGGGEGSPPRWPDGRYVIRLAAPTGAYARYLGLEVGVVSRAAGASPGGDPGASPGDLRSPGASPGAEP